MTAVKLINLSSHFSISSENYILSSCSLTFLFIYVQDFDLSNIGPEAGSTPQPGHRLSTTYYGNITPPPQKPQPLIQVKLNFSKLMQLLLTRVCD